MGCWKDTWDRAIPILEGKSLLLGELDYKARSNALMKCAEVAKSFGLRIFAVQNGGQCFGGKDAERTFMKYGVADSCRGGCILLLKFFDGRKCAKSRRFFH